MTTKPAPVSAFPAVPTHADLSARTEAMLAEFGAQVDALCADAAKIEITDDASEAEAGNVRVVLGSLDKRIDNGLRDLFAPWNAAIKSLRAKLDRPRSKISDTLESLRKKLKAHAERKFEAAQKAADAENKRAAKAHEKAVAKAERTGGDAPAAPAVAEAQVSSRMGAATVRRIWSYRVTEIGALPAEYLDVKHGDILRALSRLEGEGKISEAATEKNPVRCDALPGLVAFKVVSA